MRILLLIVLVLLNEGLSAAPSRYPVPNGAIEVQHVRLADTGGEQDFFKIELKYPSTSVLDHYRNVFSRWGECKPKGAWQSFGDLTGNKPLFVHQLLWEWVSADNRSVATLAIRYYSDGVQYRAQPDIDTQHVVLIEYKVPDARAMAKELGYQCAGT